MPNDMRDRLVSLINQDNRPSPYMCDNKCKYSHLEYCFGERLADHLIANGVIIPPCKVGDMVYKFQYCRCGNPEAFEMKHCHKKETSKTPKVLASVMLQQKGKRLRPDSYFFEGPKYEYKPIGTICYKVVQKPFKLEWLTEIGKTVFLTLEEAEQKLKEMRVESDL